MGNLHSCLSMGLSDRVNYNYALSLSESEKSLPPILTKITQLEAGHLMVTKVSQTPCPRILSVACGFGDDVPVYRKVFGESCSIQAMDACNRFSRVEEREKNLGRQTRFTQADARHLPFEPCFDLVTFRHPEPARAKKIWLEIFIEAAIFAQKSKAALLVTTFSQHELDYFIHISTMMGQDKGVELVEQYENNALEPKIDRQGVVYGRDRFVALFNPIEREHTIGADEHL